LTPLMASKMNKLKRTLEILREGEGEVSTKEEAKLVVSRFRELEIEVSARSM
jgi:hypothetical protein